MFNKIKNHNLIEPKPQINNYSSINTLITLNDCKIIDNATVINVINSLKNNITPEIQKKLFHFLNRYY